MVADLLADEPGLLARVAELADEDFAQEGVEGLLDAVGWRAAGVLLAAEGDEEPLEDGEEASFGGLFVGGSDEEVGVFDPVAGEFGGGFVREDEWGRGDVA